MSTFSIKKTIITLKLSIEKPRTISIGEDRRVNKENMDPVNQYEFYHACLLAA